MRRIQRILKALSSLLVALSLFACDSSSSYQSKPSTRQSSSYNPYANRKSCKTQIGTCFPLNMIDENSGMSFNHELGALGNVLVCQSRNGVVINMAGHTEPIPSFRCLEDAQGALQRANRPSW